MSKDEQCNFLSRVGDEGQRYEVRCIGEAGKEMVMGWTDRADGGGFVESVNLHPVWHDCVVHDRNPELKPEPNYAEVRAAAEKVLDEGKMNVVLLKCSEVIAMCDALTAKDEEVERLRELVKYQLDLPMNEAGDYDENCKWEDEATIALNKKGTD